MGRARDLLSEIRSAQPPNDEGAFRSWYADRAQRLGLNADPDDPRHHYDYRAAYRAGAEPGPDGHWPSKFKADDHPNRFINGVDTKVERPSPRQVLADIRRVSTPTLDAQGIDSAEVKRRAAADEPIVQSGLRRATPWQEVGAQTAAGIAGFGEGMGGALGLAADVATAPIRAMRGGLRDGMSGAARDILSLPATRTATEAADDAEKNIRGAMGIDEGVAESPSARVTRFAADLAAPGPEVLAATRKIGGTGAIDNIVDDVIPPAESIIGDPGPITSGGPMEAPKGIPVPDPGPRGPGELSHSDLQTMIDDVPEAKFRDAQFRDLGPVESKPISLLDPRRAANKLDGAEDGPVRKTFIDPVEKADADLLAETEQMKARVQSFTKGIKPGSEADQLIRRYGEGIATPEDMAKVTPEMERAAGQFRGIYDELLDRVNKAREIAGQAPVPKRSDYFTHAEEMGVMESLFGSFDNVPDHVARKRFAHPSAPFFQFALPRTVEESSAGAVEGFQRYMQPALRTIHFAEPVTIIRQNAEFLPPRAKAYFTEWADSLTGKMHPLDEPFPAIVVKLAKTIRHLTSRGVVLGNISTAILQPSSVASTISRTGIHSLGALPETFTQAGKNFARTYSRVLAGRRFDPDITPGAMSKVSAVLGYALSTADELMVRHAFLSGFKKATKEGKAFQEAVRYADDIASKTQADTRKAFAAPVMRSEIGGLAGQLQTFTINLYNQIARDIPRIAQGEGKMEAVKAAVTLGASMYAINKVYEAAGLRTPFEMPTAVVPFTGSIKYGEPTPALQGVVGAGQVAFGDDDDRKKGLQRLGKFGVSLVPGGRQAQKSYQGVEAIREGGVRNKKGKQLFPVEGPIESIRAVLFGPWGTKAAQEYWKEKEGK